MHAPLLRAYHIDAKPEPLKFGKMAATCGEGLLSIFFRFWPWEW